MGCQTHTCPPSLPGYQFDDCWITGTPEDPVYWCRYVNINDHTDVYIVQGSP